MKSTASFFLIFVYLNSALIPHLDEVDVVDAKLVQLEDINSILELLIIAYESDNVGEDEDDDNGDEGILVIYHHHLNHLDTLVYYNTTQQKHYYTKKSDFWYCSNYNGSYISINSPPPKIC
jgi:hypothetical protein